MSLRTLQVKSATGAAAISVSGPVVDDNFELVSVIVTFDAAPTTSENLTVSLDANAGAAYDATLLTIDPSVLSNTSVVYKPGDGMSFVSGDKIVVAYANTDTATYTVEIRVEVV